jgi:hypothetical protein
MRVHYDQATLAVCKYWHRLLEEVNTMMSTARRSKSFNEILPMSYAIRLRISRPICKDEKEIFSVFLFLTL